MAELPRIAFLRREHEARLIELAQQQGFTAAPPFETAVGMDPTTKGIYLQTVLRWLSTGTARFEDRDQVRKLLERFHARKRGLSTEQRDVGAYDSPGDIAAILDTDIGDGIGDFPDCVPEWIREDTTIIAKGPNWSLHRIDGPNGASWWAQSTRWCTASIDTADDYLSDGPLFVAVHDGEKLQYHFPTEQLMDRHDRRPKSLARLPVELVQAMLESAVSERSRSHRAFVRCSRLEAWLADELRRRGVPCAITRHGWISSDGSRSVSFGELVPCGDGNAVYRPFVLHEKDAQRIVGREAFEAPGPIPDMILDLMRSDFERTRGSVGRNGVRRIGDIGDDFTLMWWATLPKTGRPLGDLSQFFEGWSVVDHAPHLVWIWDHQIEAGNLHRPAAICVLDLDGRAMHVMKDRADLQAAPVAVKRAVAQIGNNCGWMHPAFAMHYGLDLLRGGKYALKPAIAALFRRLLGRHSGARSSAATSH